MYIVLLTGGLASGKGVVATMLANLGATVVDLDSMAKEVQQDKRVIAKLVKAFGADILDNAGSLNRALLAKRAFADEGSTKRLNDICWPPTKRRLYTFLQELEECNFVSRANLVVIQVPLLVESPDLLALKDEVISVTAPEDLRCQRAVARGISLQDAKNRIARQASDKERIAISDTVFTNNGSIEELKEQVIAWHKVRIQEGLF